MKTSKTAPPPGPRGLDPWPLVKTLEEAETLARQNNDPRYLVAFQFQSWLGGLLQRATAEYAEKKLPQQRLLQTGEAWRAFQESFPRSADEHPVYLLTCLFRFCAADNSPANSLRLALGALAVEHRHAPGKYLSPKDLPLSADAHPSASPQPSTLNPPSPALARATIIRWCDWLDAAIHQRIHRLWHLNPACFDPDPEVRQLASLGWAQRHLAKLDPRAQICWAWDMGIAAERYKNSPKWAALGKAMGADTARPWPYAQLDTLVLALWPLVKQYNWTYRDLLNLLRPALKRPQAYPCGREQVFATYCSNVLGLHKNGKGASAKNDRPAGYDIALELCPALQGTLK